jgi:hypothetical protein
VPDELYERIAADDYLADLTQRPPIDLRAMRAECQTIEDQVSYLRRVVQGRLDILRAERRRRDEGRESIALSELIAGLPETLSGGVGGGSRNRAAHEADLSSIGDVTDEVDAHCPPDLLANLTIASADELDGAIGALTQFEHDVSDRRRTIFTRLDALADELARRYRDGEASVDALLA